VTQRLNLVLSATAIVMLFPLMTLVGLANWVFTGRVLFRQVRVGQGLRPFTIFKFQTMIDGRPGASTVTVACDRRLTTFGRLLRVAKLDELPQLLNVFRGEMSVVGPRALTPNEVARVAPDVAAHVYSVPPGLTGLASLVLVDEEQLLGHVADPEDYYFTVVLPHKMALEVLYVKRKSFWLDALILVLTPLAIVAPDFTRTCLRRVIGVPTLGDGLPANTHPASHNAPIGGR
jgi:lipopolysaccharide/colanic/teichoic acid biosynthesis glycosyltransferase